MRKDRTLEKLRAYFASADFTRPPLDDALPSGFSSTLDQANRRLPHDAWRHALIARLQKFSYPYPEGRRPEKTFYKRVDAAKILDSLLNGDLFWTTRFWLLLEDERRLERDLGSKSLSPYGCPTSFHREMAKQLIAHATAIHKVLRKHRVKVQWALKHLNSTDMQLVREVRGIFWYYPNLPLAKEVASSPADFQLEIYDAFCRALQKAKSGKGKQTLAIQLTSLVCSPSDCIQTGELDPDPEAVRKKIGYRERKLRNT